MTAPGRDSPTPATDLSNEVGPASAIYRHYRSLIATGRLGAGERLPTVRQTARDLNVAHGTAAKAIRMLEQDGLVVTGRGAGTRVAADATRISAATARQVSELVRDARRRALELDDVLDAVRAAWSDEAALNTTT
ncbi:GntR family transcriptional regulator [Gulosibacter macacae]|uniref:GntR family transcriptional regulator n=1 Tax=Gulosibacter macacae TaxID=2488791 RepID=A0A3P3VYL9_9MICO|nr:GntR family transcriptional regulator [Gulosibacter macacae]RRJ87158.1 GntR family transcriptional regulator [Gulosibacter macacae]